MNLKYIGKYWPWALALNTRPHRGPFLWLNWKHFACLKILFPYRDRYLCPKLDTRLVHAKRLNQSCRSNFMPFVFCFSLRHSLRRCRFQMSINFTSFGKSLNTLKTDRCFEKWTHRQWMRSMQRSIQFEWFTPYRFEERLLIRSQFFVVRALPSAEWISILSFSCCRASSYYNNLS